MGPLHTTLPKWLEGRRYCTIKDLMRLFGVSRATIDRWCRENESFPSKHKFGNPFNENCSTRFSVSEVKSYISKVEQNQVD
ncbi:helix-turn-helix domain-containing protein [Pacificibacter marinus]|nr:helix-turn-helix domain-containing protein [Pacificibacter marinus]